MLGVALVVVLLGIYHPNHPHIVQKGDVAQKTKSENVRKHGRSKPHSEMMMAELQTTQHLTIAFLFLFSHNHWAALCVHFTGTITLIYNWPPRLLQSTTFADCRHRIVRTREQKVGIYL